MWVNIITWLILKGKMRGYTYFGSISLFARVCMNKTLMLFNIFVLMVTLPHGQIKTSPSVDHKGAHLH